MKIIVLVDNQKHPENDFLEAEHGLSFYIETEQQKLLLDVGASDNFLKNAKALDIDIANVDTLILSHAHSDHTGGLEAFLLNNDKALIYLSSNINDLGYYSNRRGLLRDISIDYSLVQKNKKRFKKISHNFQISPFIQIISEIPTIYNLPKANTTLLTGNNSDKFNHEIALLLTQGEQTVILSSCTHLGLLNTLKACKNSRPKIFIGGLHLVDSDNFNTFETQADYNFIAENILSEYPNLQIYTGHCTGNNAKHKLAELLPGQINTFYTGLELYL